LLLTFPITSNNLVGSVDCQIGTKVLAVIITGDPATWNANVGDAEIGIYGGHVTSIEIAGLCPSPSHVTSSGLSGDRVTSNVTCPLADRGHVTSSVPLPYADHVTSICSSSANETCRPDNSHRLLVSPNSGILSVKITATGDGRFATVHRIRNDGNQVKDCHHFLGQTVAWTAPCLLDTRPDALGHVVRASADARRSLGIQ
jgi:hypothetical protein